MRLIDADELIKQIGKWMPEDPVGREQTVEEIVAADIAASVCMEIEEMPTAFDKEKVINELLSASICSAPDEDSFVELEEAIEIIEEGGIE